LIGVDRAGRRRSIAEASASSTRSSKPSA